MLIINKTKPFYINKNKKYIRMGNFKNTGKEINYEDDNILSIFKYIQTPISKSNLVKKVSKETGINVNEVRNVIDYLIAENFIIDNKKYCKIIGEERYCRQNLFFNMINDKYIIYNNNFKNKNIVVLGLGGIGANVTLMLSRSGFDTFTLIDFDKVEYSNLVRQYPYTENDIGKLKSEILEKRLKSKDKVFKKNIRITQKQDVFDEISHADFVVCTLDKPTRVIRRLINEICIEVSKPVIFAGFAEHMAMIGPFIVPNKTACLLCNEKVNEEEPLNNVDIVPSYGPICAMISSIVTNEIVNYFSNYNTNNLIGKTLMIDILSYDMKVIKWEKNNKCKVCGNNGG